MVHAMLSLQQGGGPFVHTGVVHTVLWAAEAHAMQVRTIGGRCGAMLELRAKLAASVHAGVAYTRAWAAGTHAAQVHIIPWALRCLQRCVLPYGMPS